MSLDPTRYAVLTQDRRTRMEAYAEGRRAPKLRPRRRTLRAVPYTPRGN